VASIVPLASGALPLVGHAPEFLRDQRRLLERGYTEHGPVFRLRLGLRPAVFPGDGPAAPGRRISYGTTMTGQLACRASQPGTDPAR
jgi:hypothetical protein